MANLERGELEVEIGGERVTLAANFECLMELESRMGVGVTAIAARFMRGEFGAKEVVAILHAGLLGAGNRKWTFEQLGAVVVRQGVVRFSKPAKELLLLGMRGPDPMPGENPQAGEIKEGS